MREEEIKKYIVRLNNDDFEETIFLRQINKFVDFARVWEKEPELNDRTSLDIPSYRFFFIKNENGKYVGAVLDMKKDLHWYILEEERKKGYLTRSLREAIIPYLFYEEEEYFEREVQRITIQFGIGELNYKNSRIVAESIGFKPINDDETDFELSKDEFDWQYENLDEKNGTISSSRFKELRKRLILYYRQLIKISDELLVTYGDDKDLREAANEISYFNLRIEDIEWENNKENK